MPSVKRRPPFAGPSWQQGDPPPRARYAVGSTAVAAVLCLASLGMQGRARSGLLAIAAGMLVLMLIVLVLPARYYDWYDGAATSADDEPHEP